MSAYSRSGAGRPVKNGFPNETSIGTAPNRNSRSDIFIPHEAQIGAPKNRSKRGPERVYPLIMHFFLSRRSTDRVYRIGTPKIPFQTRPGSGLLPIGHFHSTRRRERVYPIGTSKFLSRRDPDRGLVWTRS